MNVRSVYKKLGIFIAMSALAVGAFLVYALAGLGAHPIEFAEPPAFVEKYAAQLDHSDSPPLAMTPGSGSGGPGTDAESANMTADFSKEDAVVRNVILGGASPDILLRLFAHSDRTQRVKAALAFASVNAELTHDEESGFADKRGQFWKDVAPHVPDIQNALFEALIVSAEEEAENYIPYTLAWMPDQGQATVELLAWAAKHHPDPWVRKFSVFFVVQHGDNEDLASPLLRDRTHDPEYRVRKEVLDQRLRRLLEGS